ncbi:retrovirus-related pol polyprotein from transposon TNT 1-94 [Tanacetum coccineum]
MLVVDTLLANHNRPKKRSQDVKSAFLNGVIDEEVNVAQPPDFVDFQRPNHVNKLKKALYGLKQDPKAWKRFLTLDKDSEPIDSTKYRGMIGEVKLLSKLRSSPIVLTSKQKHIEIRHHFLKDNVVKKYITIDKIPLGENVANILTKPLEKDQFDYLRLGLGLMLPEEEEEKKGQDDEVKEPLSPKLNEDEYSICCENATHMMNALKEARMESREMLLSILHSLKMLLGIISKMNRKLED